MSVTIPCGSPMAVGGIEPQGISEAPSAYVPLIDICREKSRLSAAGCGYCRVCCFSDSQRSRHRCGGTRVFKRVCLSLRISATVAAPLSESTGSPAGPSRSPQDYQEMNHLE
eukprot:scaffold74070_cov67-Phaeocystis_antarctica.AAC.5